MSGTGSLASWLGFAGTVITAAGALGAAVIASGARRQASEANRKVTTPGEGTLGEKADEIHDVTVEETPAAVVRNGGHP